MLKNILFVVSVLALATAQIPSLGYCPEYVPMAKFDMGKFLGVWYEAERYFQFLDPISRCVMTNYTKSSDGKYRVSNEVTNRITGIKRVLDGEIRTPASKAEEGKLHVKYTTVPLTPATQYAVLESDYKSFAVLWSCNGIGPLRAQSAWVMTRARKAEGAVLQKAYGVLDKYKIPKAYFIKTSQDDCAWFDQIPPAPKPSETPSEPTVEEPPAVETVVEQHEATRFVNLRSAVVPETPSIDVKTIETSAALSEPETTLETKVQNVEPIVAAEEIVKNLNPVEKSVELTGIQPSSVPEVILNVADRAKEILQKTFEQVKKFEPIETIKETFEKPVAQIQSTFEKPVEKIQEAFNKPIEQIKETFEKPYEQIKETFEKPYEQIKETFQQPLDKIKEVLNLPESENKEKIIVKEIEQSQSPD